MSKLKLAYAAVSSIFLGMAFLYGNPDAANSKSHPITILDTLNIVRPTAVQISPDGALVAYVTTQPVLASNQNRSILNLAPATGEPGATVLTQATRIESLHWYADSHTLLYLS